MGADAGSDATEAEVSDWASSTNYMLCLCEASVDADTGGVEFGLLALQCATGEEEMIQMSPTFSHSCTHTKARLSMTAFPTISVAWPWKRAWPIST